MNNLYFFFAKLSYNWKIFSLLFIIAFCFLVQPSFARKVYNKAYMFKIGLPSSMKIFTDTAEGDIYYDTITQVILIISGRESKFHKVDDYINCSRKDLEGMLRNWSSDSTLQIESCNKTKKATILHFRVGSMLNDSYRDNIIYFIHHIKKIYTIFVSL